MCGRQAIDGDTAQVGPQLAEALNLPQITYVQKVEINGGKIKAERELEDGYEVIETEMPALLTIIKEMNEARYPTLQGIDKAYEKEVKVWKADDINADVSKIGLKASPTMVKKVFSPSAKGQGLILQCSIKEMAHDLVERLKEREIIQKF